MDRAPLPRWLVNTAVYAILAVLGLLTAEAFIYCGMIPRTITLAGTTVAVALVHVASRRTRVIEIERAVKQALWNGACLAYGDAEQLAQQVLAQRVTDQRRVGADRQGD